MLYAGGSLRSVFPQASAMLVPYYRKCCRGGVRLTCGIGLLRRYGSEEKRHARNCTPELVLIPFGDIPVDPVTKLFVR